MKILILKRDKLGDMLLATPMLAHLRRMLPDAEIHMLANDYNAWVIQGDPNIDKLWIYPRVRLGDKIRPFAVFKQLWSLLALRAQRYDFAIAAGGGISPRALQRISRFGATRTVAFCEGLSLCARITDPLPFPNGLHEVELNLRLLEPLGIVVPAQSNFPVYKLPDQWQDFARDWLARQGLGDGTYVVIGLNARRTSRKPTVLQIARWAEHFKHVWGLNTVLVWTPGEATDKRYPGDDELVKPLLANCPPWVYPFASTESVMPLLGLVWHAKTSIFPDSGLMHFAAASPGGVLGLFANTAVSSHPGRWGPRGHNVAHLEADKSVEDLTDEQVFAVVARLIAAPAIFENTNTDSRSDRCTF